MHTRGLPLRAVAVRQQIKRSTKALARNLRDCRNTKSHEPAEPTKFGTVHSVAG